MTRPSSLDPKLLEKAKEIVHGRPGGVALGIEVYYYFFEAIALALQQYGDEKVEECAKMAEHKWAMKRFFDTSDQEKWGEEYTAKMDLMCDGWNKAKDEIAQAIRKLKGKP